MNSGPKLAAGSLCHCTPRLLMAPAKGGLQLIQKADWQKVGHVAVNGRQLYLAIDSPFQRRGLATEAWKSLASRYPAQLPIDTGEKKFSEAARAWLSKLGWKNPGQTLADPQPLDFASTQKSQARRWADQLGIPKNYPEQRQLALVEEPDLLQCLGQDIYQRPIFLTPAASRAWQTMQQAASADGVGLQPVSGFRSIGYQAAMLERKLARGADLTQVLNVSAAPGYSEHHSGRALDIATPGSDPLEAEFAHTPAFAWLSTRAAGFGYRLSYPADNPHQLAFEPWHWCFHPHA